VAAERQDGNRIHVNLDNASAHKGSKLRPFLRD
jgi:transposase